MGDEGHFDEVSDGNEKYMIGNWRKSNPHYKVAQNLDELGLCSSVLWKVEVCDMFWNI